MQLMALSEGCRTDALFTIYCKVKFYFISLSIGKIDKIEMLPNKKLDHIFN